jgi:NTE family protein
MRRAQSSPHRALAGPACAVLCAAAALVGCYPRNLPLEHYDPARGYRYGTLAETGADTDSDATFVVLTFSGGGTRAAAFAYGVLDALRATDIGDGRSLLDEVDVISSVSGGSFTAAYLGLFGQRAFLTDFRAAGLDRPIERDLFLRILAPWNWPRLASPYFSRSDLADEYYDGSIFQHRRFADVPRRRPFIVLNATDIARGAQFSFTQEHFDRLCSDLSDVTVSRGVTASSAFPVAFPPLTFINYGWARCGYTPPAWDWDAVQEDLDINPQLYDLAKTWQSYEDKGRRQYVHLSDGGLADNIGLRAIETGIISTDSFGLIPKINDGAVRRLVVIVVDAKPESEFAADQSARPPGVSTVLEAAATNPMENYSSDTIERVRLWFDEWDQASLDFDQRRSDCDALAVRQCERSRPTTPCETRQRDACYASMRCADNDRPPHPELYLIPIRFEAVRDETAKRRLQRIGTRLQLPPADIDLLVDWARRLLYESPRYQDLVTDLRRGA